MRVEKSSRLEAVLLIGVLAAVLVGYGLPAVAQQPPAEQPTEAEQEQAVEEAMQRSFEEEITVTGSLIPRPTLEAMSPVTVMEPEQIIYSGVTRIEDLVKQLPQVFSAQNSTISNGASGTATVDLRNLGAERTLVLINGRRTVPGDAWEIAGDLNFIPPALVKRVDVLTGGASSVYGADAVTGVVNFVLDTDFEGLKGSISWAAYNHDNSNATAQAMNAAKNFDAPSGMTTDGEQYNINLALGHKFGEGRGHAAIYIDHRNVDGLLKSERDYLNCAPARGATGPYCGGSGTWPLGRFQVYNREYSRRLGDYTLDTTTGNTFRTRTANDVYNYAPRNFVQRPDTKWSAGAFMNYEFNEKAEVYAEVMFMDDFSEAQIAESANFNNTEVLNCDNPMLSAQQRNLICTQNGYLPTEYANVVIGRRSLETGPRTSIMRHTSWRMVSGVRGDLSDAWSYDLYGMYAETSSPQEYVGDLSVTRMADALDVIGDPANPSTWRCRSGNEGCAPWNIFRVGGVTPEAADYIMMNMVLTSGAKTELFGLKFNGDLEEWGLKFGTATEGIQLALGAEYRQESLYVHPDDNWEAGNGSGQGGPTVAVDGSYNVTEYFAEALVPIIQDASLFKDLSLELGYRSSDYSTAGTQETWKAQAAWAPADLLKFRAGIARAARAPNVRELFRPQGLGLGGSADPCANDETTGRPSMTLEQCLRTGMTQAQYGNVPSNPADQYNSLEGGNPLLDPETADTLTFGVVLTPPSISGFSLALDYFDIEITDTIDSLDPDTVLTACAATGDPTLCGLIHRDRAGTLWLFEEGYTIATEQNIGTIYSEGVDLNFAWLIGLGDAGYLNTGLIGTYMIADRFANPLVDFDCVGYYGNQCEPYPTPEWRHRATLSWETNFNMVFSLGWRYIDAVLVDSASPDEDLANPATIPEHQANGTYENPAFNYFDLAFSWNIGEHYQLVLGCNNVMDEEPPLAPGMNDNDYGPGFYGFYDPYGRYVHAAIHFDF